jgi:hypothetical protein
VRFDVRQIALLLLLMAPAAQAQLWSGPAAVEVRVEDQKGPPVAGAQLVLQYNGVNPKDGPPAVFTDAKGKATVGGLAEGSWHLEVSHEGYMTYLAEITVREKGRLVLEEAAQFNVVGATRTMRVQVSRGKSVPVPRTVVAEKSPAPAPVQPPPAPAAPTPRPENPPAPEPAAAEPTAPLAPTSEPPQEQPAPAPEPSQAKPVTPPAPAPVQPPPAAPPAPAPEPEKPAVPEPPPAKPVTPPTPAPTPPPVPEPAIQPAPAPPAPPPADPVRLRTSKDRTCFECPPGESALSTERVVPPGGGSGCGGDLASQLQSGAVPGGLPAGCHVLRIALPAGTRYTGYRYEVQMGGDSLDCLAGQSCPQSTGRWPINPVLVRNPDGTVVLAPFEAGPSGSERRAILTVYFTTAGAKRK